MPIIHVHFIQINFTSRQWLLALAKTTPLIILQSTFGYDENKSTKHLMFFFLFSFVLAVFAEELVMI